MFEIERHRHEYLYNYVTVVPGVIPLETCNRLNVAIGDHIRDGVPRNVQHEGQGTRGELDYGGAYRHHLFDGSHIRAHFPYLMGVYQVLRPLVSLITCCDVVHSPYPVSDVNIKAYPSAGGTIGWHEDTNGITCLIYLTTNTEGQLLLDVPVSKPWMDEVRFERRTIQPVAGSMLLMQGRKVKHMSTPMASEVKNVVVYNFYQRGDTWRPTNFDELVYEGKPTREACSRP